MEASNDPGKPAIPQQPMVIRNKDFRIVYCDNFRLRLSEHDQLLTITFNTTADAPIGGKPTMYYEDQVAVGLPPIAVKQLLEMIQTCTAPKGNN